MGFNWPFPCGTPKRTTHNKIQSSYIPTPTTRVQLCLLLTVLLASSLCSILTMSSIAEFKSKIFRMLSAELDLKTYMEPTAHKHQTGPVHCSVIHSLSQHECCLLHVCLGSSSRCHRMASGFRGFRNQSFLAASSSGMVR